MTGCIQANARRAKGLKYEVEWVEQELVYLETKSRQSDRFLKMSWVYEDWNVEHIALTNDRTGSSKVSSPSVLNSLCIIQRPVHLIHLHDRFCSWKLKWSPRWSVLRLLRALFYLIFRGVIIHAEPIVSRRCCTWLLRAGARLSCRCWTPYRRTSMPLTRTGARPCTTRPLQASTTSSSSSLPGLTAGWAKCIAVVVVVFISWSI